MRERVWEGNREEEKWEGKESKTKSSREVREIAQEERAGKEKEE